MKKIFNALLLMLVMQLTRAQYVTIPDAGFVSWLNTYGFSSCMSGNRMDTTCAKIMDTTSLSFSYPSPAIHDLTGIQYFKSVTTLTILNCPNLLVIPSFPNTIQSITMGAVDSLTALPPFPTALTYIVIQGATMLTTLPAWPNNVLNVQLQDFPITTLHPWSNSVVSLSLINLPATQLPAFPPTLQSLWISNVPLSALPAFPPPLYYIYIYDDDSLTSLPALPATLHDLLVGSTSITALPTLPGLVDTVVCAYNKLISLPDSMPNSVTSFDCDANQLTRLPILSNRLQIFHCSDNPGITCLPYLPSSLQDIEFTGTAVTCAPNYLPLNDGIYVYETPLLTSLPLCQPGNTNGCYAALVTAGPNQTICINSTATMAANDTGTWIALSSNPAATIIANPTLPTTTITGFTLAGNYGYKWGNAPGDTIYVTVVIPPVSTISVIGSCLGHDSLLVSGASNADSIAWFLNYNQIAKTAAADSFFIPTIPGYYGANTISSPGCVYYGSEGDSVLVSSCTSAAGPNQTVCLNSTATMAATGTGSWTALAANPAVTTITNATSPNTTITGFTVAGTYGYKWGTAPGDTMYVYAVSSVSPYVTVTPTSASICSGGTDTLTAIQRNGDGGTSPSYQWYIDGVATGTNSNVLVITPPTTSFIKFDSINVLMTSSLACATPPNPYSYSYWLLVNPEPATPTISLNGTCLSSDTLVLDAGVFPTQIDWYKGTTLVGIDSFPPVTVAGGNGAGSAANQLNEPQGVFVDANGNLYVLDNDNNRVQKFPAGSTSLTNGVTVAGGNGRGSAANQFAYPAAIYVDANGNLYVADAGNQRIQKFPAGSTSATNGITAAGGNGSGSGANQFDYPTGMYGDAAGNIYVSDQGNYRIQKFPAGSTSATSGVTVAGGNGGGSGLNQFEGPESVFIDVNNNIYVSDMSRGVMKFPAGSTSATFGTIVVYQGLNQSQDDGVSEYVTSSGAIYVAGQNNDCVLEYPAAGGWTSMGITVAGGNGTGSAENQFDGVADVFLDAAGNIYVADVQNNRVQKWPGNSVHSPSYVPANAGNYTATYITANGGCTSAASNAVTVQSCGTAGPNQTKCQYGPGQWPVMPQFTMAATGTGTWSGLSTNPSTLSFGNVTSPTTIIGGTILPGVYGFVWATIGGRDTMTVTVNPAPPRPVLAELNTCLSSDSLVVYNAGAATSINWWISSQVFLTTAASDSFYRPALASTIEGFEFGITVTTLSAQGCTSLWSDTIATPDTIPSVTIALYDSICSGALDSLLAMPANGGASPSYQWYRNNVATGSNSPFMSGTFVTGDSIKVVMNSSFACAYPATVSASVKLTANPVPNAPTLVVEGGNCLGRDSLLVTGDGFPYGLSWYLSGNTVRNRPFPARTVAGGAGYGNALNQLSEAWQVFVDRNGYIYVSDQYNYRVLKFPPGSTAGSYGEVVTPFIEAWGICVDTAGYLYVASMTGNVILKFPPGSNSTTPGVIVAGNGTAGSAANELSGAGAIFINSSGELFVADGARVQKFPAGSDSSTQAVTVAANQISAVSALTYDAAGNIYVADQYNYHVLKFPANSTATTTGTVVAGGNGHGSAANQFGYEIFGIATDAAGNLYVSDADNSRVLKFPAGSTSATNGITVAGGPTIGVLPNQLSSPRGLWMDASNDLYILDAQRVQEWTAFYLDSFYTPIAAGNYTSTYIAADGCKSAVSNTVTVQNCGNVDSHDSVTICRGSSYQMNNITGGSNADTYLWIPPTGLSSNAMLNPVASPVVTTRYTLIAIDTTGSAYYDTVLITVDSVCTGFVWPGDADDNGIVDNTDLLPIGLTYGFTGPARPQQDINWYAHSATPWAGTNSGGINNVYSDCDGNDTVDVNDVQAILQNYSLVHAKMYTPNNNRSGAPVLKITVSPDTVLNGDTLTCHIILGDSIIPASNVYGLAFTFNFNPLVVDTTSVKMTFPDSWLATQSEHITLAKNEISSGNIYAGLSRIDRVSRSGSGEIATVSMVITTDNIDGKNLSYYTDQLSISGIKVINQLGDTIPVNAQPDSAIIGFLPTGILATVPDAVNIKLFPDPANNSAQICSVRGKMSVIVLTDVLGRQVAGYDAINASNFTMPTGNLNAGVYFAQILIGNTTVVKKFLVQH